MNDLRVSKPLKSRLGQRRTLSLKPSDGPTANLHNFSIMDRNSGADMFPNPSNVNRGVNKCLFGNSKNQRGQDFGSLETPHLSLMASKVKNMNHPRRCILDGTLYSSKIPPEQKHQDSTVPQQPPKHFQQTLIPFNTPGGNDVFPDLESREKDDGYVWSVFKTKKSNIGFISPGKKSLNPHSNTKQEQCSVTRNNDTTNASKTSAGSYRFLQYQSGVLKSPKAPERTFNFSSFQMVEPKPPVPSQTSSYSTTAANSKQYEHVPAVLKDVTNDESSDKSDLNDSVESGHDSTNSFIENECTLVQLDDNNCNSNMKSYLSATIEQDNRSRCQIVNNENSVVDNDTKEKMMHADTHSREAMEDIENRAINQEYLSVSLMNYVKNKSGSPIHVLGNKHSNVISTKIRRSLYQGAGPNNAKPFSPDKVLKELRANGNQSEDNVMSDSGTECEYMNLNNNSRNTRLSTVLEHDIPDKNETVNTNPKEEKCTTTLNSHITEPSDNLNRIELRNEDLSVLNSIINDIVQRQQKMDCLLNSYLQEKEIVDKQMISLFGSIKKCLNQQSDLKTDSLLNALSETSKLKFTSLTDNAERSKSPMNIRRTPIRKLSNPSPKVSVNSKSKFRKTSAAQAYTTLRASYSCLRTPVTSQKKKNKRQNCYTPQSLSICVDEQMKDIFED